MQNEQVCPNCNETVENGAVYCGNCGHRLTAEPSFLEKGYQNSTETAAPSPTTLSAVPVAAVAPVSPSIPSYAIPTSHHKQHFAALALSFGVLGIAASVMLPILGIAFGLIGLVLISLSFKITHGWLRLVGLIIPAVAVLAGLGFWVKAYNDAKLAAPSGTTNGTAMMSVSTPCFSLTFNEILNVSNTKGSCNLNAYNNSTFASSTDVYKILAEDTTVINSTNFISISKPAIADDISKNLSGFTVTTSRSALFAGSQAYYDVAYDSSSDTTFIEETVYHPSSTNSDNFYDIIHAVNGQTTNLSEIEDSWHWN